MSVEKEKKKQWRGNACIGKYYLQSTQSSTIQSIEGTHLNSKTTQLKTGQRIRNLTFLKRTWIFYKGKKTYFSSMLVMFQAQVCCWAKPPSVPFLCESAPCFEWHLASILRNSFDIKSWPALSRHPWWLPHCRLSASGPAEAWILRPSEANWLGVLPGARLQPWDRCKEILGGRSAVHSIITLTHSRGYLRLGNLGSRET
jgi:hypothetical protein